MSSLAFDDPDCDRTVGRRTFETSASLEGRWDQLEGAKQSWGTLADDELDVPEGDDDEMIGKMKERTGETEEAIRARLDKD